MKLSFSTNGWKLDFESLVKVCVENKISGIEIHDINAEPFADSNPFDSKNIKKTKKVLFQNGLSISCFDSICNFADIDNIENNVKEIENLISLANAFNSSFVRIHTFEFKGYKQELFYDILDKYLPNLISLAVKNNVTILLESMGVFKIGRAHV